MATGKSFVFGFQYCAISPKSNVCKLFSPPSILHRVASFRRAQKMPSILSSDAYLLICDKKRCFFAYYQNCNKKGSFYLVLPSFYLVLPSFYLVFTR